MRRRGTDHRHAVLARHYRQHPHLSQFLPAVSASDPDESDQHFDVRRAWKVHRSGMIVIVMLALLIAMLVGVYIGHVVWR